MVASLLLSFAERARSGPFAADFVHHEPGSGAHDQHTVFGFAIHGNEHGTLPAALRLLDEFRAGAVRPRGPVTLLIGNVEAIRKNERFLEEDFNRVFTFDRPAESLERRRAEEVRPVLDAADFFLDFHQTQTPTERAFWTFPWDPHFGLWARALAAAPVGLTRKSGQSFSPGTCCLDEYVRDRGRLGLTVELGYRGQDPSQAEACYRACLRALELVDTLQSGARDLAQLAEERPPLSWYQTAHIVRAETPAHRLRPGYQNWTPVEAGELLSPPGAPELRAPLSGVVLFPKYPPAGQAPPPELLRIAGPVTDWAPLSS